ncbi:hypothetical protein Tco_0504931 [Tanacetum coccineum]
MAEVSVLVFVVDEATVEHRSQLPRRRLLMVLAREFCVDIRKVGDRRMSRELRKSVRGLSACIAELRALGDYEDRYEALRLLERLRLDNTGKAIHFPLMMKETQLKITKKGNFMVKLREIGGVV